MQQSTGSGFSWQVVEGSSPQGGLVDKAVTQVALRLEHQEGHSGQLSQWGREALLSKTEAKTGNIAT